MESGEDLQIVIDSPGPAPGCRCERPQKVLDSGMRSRVHTALVGDNSKTLRSGTLAKATGLSPDTIRHYEKLGVIPRASRSESSSYRLYPENTVERGRGSWCVNTQRRSGSASWRRMIFGRTAAKLCRSKGGELEQIQFLLGHDSINARNA